MTAANDIEFQNANRRLNRLLGFLIVFFFAIGGIAAAHRYHILGAGESQTVFDSKGILTGPGTLLVLLAAALAALILFVVYKKWSLVRPSEDTAKSSKSEEKLNRALADWLAEDVLRGAAQTDRSALRIEGSFQNRKATVERFATVNPPFERYAIDAQTGLSLRVWWLGKWQKKSEPDPSQNAPAAEHATQDAQFEACCAWQSATPADSVNFLNRAEITGTLHRLSFMSGQKSGAPDETGIVFEANRIVLTTRMPAHEFMHAASALVFLQDLAFLADVGESKSARQILAGIDAQTADNGVGQFLETPRKKRSAFMDALSCALFVVFVLVPLAAIWIGGSYYCAKALDMSAGMLCFFVPVLLMAIFVFTRPSEPAAGAGYRDDIETVRAAALKYWEQRLRGEPAFAALLEKYEQRAKNL